jgi:hypothetical protein
MAVQRGWASLFNRPPQTLWAVLHFASVRFVWEARVDLIIAMVMAISSHTSFTK